MAAEQERLEEMTQELADIAVVDEFIRIKGFKSAMLKKRTTISNLSRPFSVAGPASLDY